jgi:UDP-glucose 4-epimerase
MRLFVTGGAGSLGSNLIEHLGSRCDEVLVLDNFSTGKREALVPRTNLRVVEGTIEDSGLVRELVEGFRPTHVVHSAASYKDPNDWARDASVNVLGTINVLRACESVGVQRLVNFQTALCYGRPTRVPIPVDAPTDPFTSYSISKTAGESYLQISSLSWVSLRLANITGPRLAIGPIPTFYKRLKSGEPCSVSTTIRDFLDVSDFLSLLDVVLESSATGIYNVSTGEGHSICEVFQEVANHMGMPEISPQSIREPGIDDVPTVVLDPSLTNKVFKWSPTVGFSETISKVLDWYDVNGLTDIYSHLREKK